MRVLIVNTSERTGGAAVAAGRLMEALNSLSLGEGRKENGVKAKMLVRDKQTNRLTVVRHPAQRKLRWMFLWERLMIWIRLRFRRKHLFNIDTGQCGADITQLAEFQEADIIHLHWINQGMLSLKQIRKILDSGKRVVWTMHDIWPATAVCHLTDPLPASPGGGGEDPLPASPRGGGENCRKFEKECGDPLPTSPRGGEICPHLGLARQVWRKKQQMLEGRHVTFVACSEWLAGEARKSALLKGQNVLSIPNPIDTRLYQPGDKKAARKILGLPEEGKMILFVAQRATNPYKGMQYLTPLLSPEGDINVSRAESIVSPSGDNRGGTFLGVIGKTPSNSPYLGGEQDPPPTPPRRGGGLPFYPLGYISDEKRMVLAYQAADVFVLPSLSENLPNTIMEAMACGVPCVGFNVGGIPEEIDHLKTGYVAAYRDAKDLARGLHWVLEEADHEALSKACVQKVATCYSQQSVARKYLEAYGISNK